LIPSPANLFLDSTTKWAAIQFNKLSANNPIIQWLPKRWRANNNPPQLAPPLPSLPASQCKSNTTQLLQVAKNTSPLNKQIFPFLLSPWRYILTEFGNRLCLLNKPVGNKDKAAQLHCNQLRKLQANRSNIIVYTDGLQKHTHHHFQRVGSGAVGFIGNQETFTAQLGLGGKTEVYDAELTGILIGLHHVQSEAEKHPLINHIIIYSDNTSALTTICDLQPRKGQILAYDFYCNAIRWLEQSDTHQLILAWCPSHLNIHGNKRANELAKLATDLPGEIDTITSHVLC